MIGRITNLFRVPEIRTRLWVTLVFLAVYRVGANVPIPGVSGVVPGSVHPSYTGIEAGLSAVGGGEPAQRLVSQVDREGR